MQKYEWTCGIIACFLAFQCSAATRYTLAVEITKGETTTKETEVVIVDGDKARIEVRGEDGEKRADTPYVLTVDGGNTWIIAGSGNVVCSKIDTTSFFNEIGASITRLDKLVGAKLNNTTVDKVLEEAGPEILGYPTTHIRLVSSVNVKARVLVFKKLEYSVEVTEDLWFTPKIEVHPIERKWIDAMVQTGYEQLDKLVKAQVSEIGGTILRQESSMTLFDVIKKDEDSRTEKATVTAIDELEPHEVPEDTFKVPECENISNKDMKKLAKVIFIPG